jgi:hypothetical protein
MLLFVIAAILIILAVLYGLSAAFSPKPINLQFEKNPIKADEEVILRVTLTNTTDFTAENVQVTAEAVGTRNIILTVQGNGFVDSMAPNEKRQIDILVNPLEDKIFEGEYRLKVTADIGSSEFTEEIKLKIEK